jgi:pimeloyl-ACP methyl ester carboxylesterase
MPYASNPLDGRRVYFEDRGGPGQPVVLLGGVLDDAVLLAESPMARALGAPEQDERFRLLLAEHRGAGRSDHPHAPADYAMPLRAGDAVAVLDAAGVERAHFTGASWGARTCLGVGQLHPERVCSLVCGGQQPYPVNPAGPLSALLAAALDRLPIDGTEGFVAALEAYAGGRVPEVRRERYLRVDPAALEAMCRALLAEGDVAPDLASWPFPVLLYAGERDLDFHDQARRAAEAMPRGTFVSLARLDHLGAHGHVDGVWDALLATLHAGAG